VPLSKRRNKFFSLVSFFPSLAKFFSFQLSSSKKLSASHTKRASFFQKKIFLEKEKEEKDRKIFQEATHPTLISQSVLCSFSTHLLFFLLKHNQPPSPISLHFFKEESSLPFGEQLNFFFVFESPLFILCKGK
jgi:hypothetical protein